MMDLHLRISLMVAIFIYLIIIINMLRKKKLELRYTLVWLFSALIMIVVVVFPQIVYRLSEIIGIVNPVNGVFVVEAMFVLVIILSLTSIVSHLNTQNRRLIQTVALLEERIRRLESMATEEKREK